MLKITYICRCSKVLTQKTWFVLRKKKWFELYLKLATSYLCMSIVIV